MSVGAIWPLQPREPSLSCRGSQSPSPADIQANNRAMCRRQYPIMSREGMLMVSYCRVDVEGEEERQREQLPFSISPSSTTAKSRPIPPPPYHSYKTASMAGLPSSTRSGPSPQPARANLDRVFDGPAGRILCVADIRGQHSLLNQLAKETGARAIIHTGDFGFFGMSIAESIGLKFQYKPTRH